MLAKAVLSHWGRGGCFNYPIRNNALEFLKFRKVCSASLGDVAEAGRRRAWCKGSISEALPTMYLESDEGMKT